MVFVFSGNRKVRDKRDTWTVATGRDNVTNVTELPSLDHRHRA